MWKLAARRWSECVAAAVCSTRVLLSQPRKYEAVMGEFLKMPAAGDYTGQLQVQRQYYLCL